MTAVVDTVDGEGTDPFGDERIELDEAELRRVSPGAYLEGMKRRLDELATRIVHGG